MPIVAQPREHHRPAMRSGAHSHRRCSLFPPVEPGLQLRLQVERGGNCAVGVVRACVGHAERDHRAVPHEVHHEPTMHRDDIGQALMEGFQELPRRGEAKPFAEIGEA